MTKTQTQVDMISLVFLRKVGKRKRYLFETENEARAFAAEKGWKIRGASE